MPLIDIFIFFFFNDTATTEIYTLSLHDALPISGVSRVAVIERMLTVRELLGHRRAEDELGGADLDGVAQADRKSTRLNSSHSQISYAVFCLKKKKKIDYTVTYSVTAHHTICVRY